MCRDDAWQAIASSLSAQMVRPVSAGPGRQFSAVLAGPGWGIDSASAAILDELLGSDLPLVLDADGLRMLASNAKTPARLSAAPLILTPHPGEFAGLAARACGKDWNLPGIPAMIAACASYFNAVVVLKNHVTWIAAPDGRLAVWDGQEPALGTGGSGDVLAGLVAGLLARGCSAFDAACAGVIAHGQAGREAAAGSGFFEASVLPAFAARIIYRGTNHGNQR
jgi:NAD(P)H-hydrate epimerase